jgi:LysM repeat protein
MKLSNPFMPSLVPASNPSRVRTTVIVTLAGQAVLMAVLLIQGCKPSMQSPPVAQDVTSSVVTTNTNTVAVEPLTTNAPSVSTNMAMSTNVTDLSASNATAALLMPPLDANGPTSGAAAAKGNYVVMSGDSFFKIAKANHITVRALKAANPDVEPHKLKVGQTLNLPDSVESDVATSSTNSAPDASPAPVTVPSATLASGTTSLIYVVKPGDTLFRIAKTQHMTVRALRSINNLSGDKIVLGQKLKLATTTAAGSQS